MKKIIFSLVTLFAFLMISCTNNRLNQNFPTGSVWRSVYITDTSTAIAFEYYEFRCVSPSTLELWVKSKTNDSPEKVNQTYAYALKDRSISINYNHMSVIGRLNKSSMVVSDGGKTMKFVKL